MRKSKYKILLFYKFVNINDQDQLKKSQLLLCQKLNLKGRMIISKQGINATFEGLEKDIDSYCLELLKDPRFKDTHLKFSEGVGNAFPRLSIKVRPEIVAARLGDDDADPSIVKPKYITVDELHSWFESGKDFYIVDVRNDYEQEVGFFKNSILTKMTSFADLPKVYETIKEIEKEGKDIVTVCTGDIRCEKANAYFTKKGVNNIYHLYGGIHTYIEKYPNTNFKGALYVFDGRIVMGFKMDDPNREIVGKCAKCQNPSEKFINCLDPYCNRQFLVCDNCLDGFEKILCPMGCRDYSKEHPEIFRKGGSKFVNIN